MDCLALLWGAVRSVLQMKKLVRLFELFCVSVLSLGMIAQPVVLIYNYVLSRRDANAERVEEIVKKSRRARASRIRTQREEEGDSLPDIEVLTLETADDDGLEKTRETRGYNTSPRAAGRTAGFEDGCYDGENGFSRNAHYDDANDFSEEGCIKYKQGYEAGYREGYNSKALL